LKKIIILAALVLILSAALNAQDTRGFYIDAGGGWTFVSYPEPFNSRINSFMALTGASRSTIDLDLSIGYAVLPNLCIVGSFGFNYDSLTVSSTLEYSTGLIGPGLKFYPLPSMKYLQLGLDIGYTAISIIDSRYPDSDDGPSGFGAQITAAYDFSSKLTGPAVLLGGKFYAGYLDGQFMPAFSIFAKFVYKGSAKSKVKNPLPVTTPTTPPTSPVTPKPVVYDRSLLTGNLWQLKTGSDLDIYYRFFNDGYAMQASNRLTGGAPGAQESVSYEFKWVFNNGKLTCNSLNGNSVYEGNFTDENTIKGTNKNGDFIRVTDQNTIRKYNDPKYNFSPMTILPVKINNIPVGQGRISLINPGDRNIAVAVVDKDSADYFVINSNSAITYSVANSAYDIYFVMSTEPNTLYRVDTVTINSQKLEITLDTAASSSYGIRKVN